MIIPIQHLLALTELLSGKPTQDPQVPFPQGNGYKINADDWSCLLSEPGYDPWFFRPVESKRCESKSHLGGSKSIPNPWSVNQRLSEEVRKSIQGTRGCRLLDDPACNFFVITSDSFGAVLGARCIHLRLVAKMLETWGNPPDSVIQDWQNQLELSTLPSTAETLVTEDGIWQVITTVGLRESPGGIPIWIGPREAQNVGNRLIDYRQWINNAIDTLRTARSNKRGQSTIDFSGEIKKLERQEREAEKGILRWKVIARLSHFFFDSNEVRLQLTAVEKP